jgi:2-keto-4-pentenoate hydratase/2-oxohepta-3-ene-1,7-dioic acid hydratase in catechol pathway
MRIIRFQFGDNAPRYGWVLGDRVGLIEGSPFGEFRRAETNLSISEVKLLAPVVPQKIVCIGRNYAAHAEEQGVQVPDNPIIFLKPTSSVIGPGDTIQLPPQSNQVEHEAELAVVIGKRGRWLFQDDALDYLLGYTIANDVTARDLQRRDGQWTRGKGFDTFCPVGPWIETEFDPTDTLITCHVNDELRQMGTTRDMVFTVQQLLVFISSVMTLEPGDLILTGTPSGVGPLKPGDQVSIAIEGLGELINHVEW